MKKTNILLYVLVIILFVGFCSSCYNAKKENASTPLPILAEKPPLGWNSWDCFAGDVNETQVKQVADYMADNLKEYGWEYVVIDGGWYRAPDSVAERRGHPCIDQYGRFMPDTIKFPSAINGAGFKPLADYIHSKGLKFGIHIMRGVPRYAVKHEMKIWGTNFKANEIAEPTNVCGWSQSMFGINMTHPAGFAYYQSIAALYDEWGVDYIKADDMSSPYQVDEIEAISTALKKSKRGIVLSLSPGGSNSVGAANHLRKNAHLWRISGDFWDTWEESLKKQFEICARWAPYVTENHWPDADMLPIGKLRKTGADEWLVKNKLKANSSEEVTNEYSRLTKDEQITMMNLWAIFRSPLMIGGYLPENNDFTLSLITNKELLELNQESINNKVVYQNEDKSIWTADLKNGKYKYLAVFNISDGSMEEEIMVEQIGLENNKVYKFTDIWSKKQKSVSGKLSVHLKPHASMLYLVEI